MLQGQGSKGAASRCSSNIGVTVLL